MQTFAVIIYTYVLEDACPGFFPGPIFPAAVNPLCLHGTEEAFHGGIVPEVTLPTNGA